jgi:hypothetical protein
MQKRNLCGDMLWLAVLVLVTLFFILPATQGIFVDLTKSHPYLMGFVKFAILATMGELLAARLASGVWGMPSGILYKMIVWGMLGMAITFMFSFFSGAVAAAAETGLLPVGSGGWAVFLKAFYTSALMNLTFGPVFMALHRVTDTFIDFIVQKRKFGRGMVIKAIDWPGFVSFVVAVTIPCWWIPVHTLTFLLPSEYRVLMAAYLSIILGVILVYARHRKVRSKTSADD